MNLKNDLKRVAKKIAAILYPVGKDKVLFINFNGRGYGWNPKYIAEELISRNEPYHYVWLVNDLNEPMPKEIEKVYIKSWKAKIELLTAKVWVFNVRNYKGIDKRKGQYYVQTWHSSIGLKKVEGDVKDFPEVSRKESMYDGQITDLMFANNDFRANQIRRAFWYDGPIIKCGVPRNAVLFNTPQSLRSKVLNEFGIKDGYGIIMYAPTFRIKSGAETYVWDYKRICKAFEEKYNKKYVMLLRLHPYVMEQSQDITFDKDVINASKYPDMQELLAVADFLITDFSSCAFDFSFAKKPVLLFAKDKRSYLSNERELLLDIDSLPYAFSETEEELLNDIKSFSENEYEKKCNEFFNSIGLHEDGQGAKVIADWVEKKMME